MRTRLKTGPRVKPAAFVVVWDADGSYSPVYPTYLEAVRAAVRAERATDGNVSGTIFGVMREQYIPTADEWTAAAEVVHDETRPV